MRLRTTLFLLAVLAVLSALVGMAVHYASTQATYLSIAEEAANVRIESISNRLETFLSEQLRPVAAMAGLPQIRTALRSSEESAISAANLLLDHFNATMAADVCYLLDSDGTTIASSNRNDVDSFVGKNFGFRPYFQQAMRGEPFTYMALGAASGERGVYYSYPVSAEENGDPLGVSVIKASVAAIERHFKEQKEVTALLVNNNGIIFIASKPEWVLQSLWQLSAADQEAIAASRQFGHGPWQWVGVTRQGGNQAASPDGRELLIDQRAVARFPGWYLTVLVDSGYDYLDQLRHSLISNRWLVLPLLLGICASVAILYRRASIEIIRRRKAQASLRANEERFRILYHNTPAMLHSVDTSMRILRVSAYWTEIMGYTTEEVIGRRITELMSEESRLLAEQEVIPEFMRAGTIREAGYQFRKKNGETIDVLLSAIAERDADGNIDRSLAVMVDITEQKRVERRLKRAQEMLHSYSRELEVQVRERTLEITNILRYTPAVVSLKDLGGRYLLVNSRFEELFGIKAQEIRGRTGHDVFPPETAQQLCAHDDEIITSGRSIAVEERFLVDRDAPIYYSVRFPLFDEEEGMNGVGCISTDVTELKRAQEMLRRLPARIIEGQEWERAAVARELHDELGQSLTALKMDASWLMQNLHDSDARASRRAAEMCEMIDRTLDEVQGMVMRLRPSVLDDLGLVPALEWLADDFEKHTGISCTSRNANLPDLEDAEANAIYRITQEALTNVARHSGATRVQVELTGTSAEGGIQLTVTDDGRGFPVAEGESDDSDQRHGVAGIRERAELLGGSTSFATNPSGGTTVCLWLPVDESRWEES